jgi:hypothetical protein
MTNAMGLNEKEALPLGTNSTIDEPTMMVQIH